MSSSTDNPDTVCSSYCVEEFLMFQNVSQWDYQLRDGISETFPNCMRNTYNISFYTFCILCYYVYFYDLFHIL